MAIVGAFMMPHPPLIIPEVGHGEEKKIKATVDACLEAARRIAALQPETIVVTSPHSVMYADYFHISPGRYADGSFASFRAGSVKMHADYDRDFVSALEEKCSREDLPAGTRGERDPSLDHAFMIPLWFVNHFYTDYKAVRIGLSGLSPADHYRLGMYIKETSEKLSRRTVFIASGDLSHRLAEDGPYGYAEEGPQYDQRIMETMSSADFGKLFLFDEDFCERAGECGQRSFTIMAGALDGQACEAQKLSYEGPFGVGYGVCAFSPQGEDPARHFLEAYREESVRRTREERAHEDAYVKLARQSVELYVREGRTPSVPQDLPREMLQQKAGAFVSIHEDGRLRGCIGTIAASKKCIAEEIIANAVSAAVSDPRFDPIRPEELDSLSVSVDILGEAEDIDGPEMLDVRKYGVIVSKGWKRGLLLPNLDGVRTVEEQIAIAKKKAGIPEGETKVSLQRFRAERHEA